jgi:hypothetical protein
MKKIFSLATVLMAVCGQVNAQVLLEGTVTDSKTGDALPFVNIAIEGTTVGTISDLNGEFKLNVPDNLVNKELTFSSVGFSPAKYNIARISEQHVSVNMSPIDYKIDEVVVTDKSQAGRRVVKNVLDKVSSVYVDRDFAYSGQYVNVVKRGGKSCTATYKYNAYDSEGYRRSDGNNAIAALNYKFQSVVRDFKCNDFASGVNYFDLVSSLDIVRYQLGVLNPYTLGDFSFTIKNDDGKTCVVEFVCNKPTVSSSGVWNVRKFEGSLTISKEDNAILETHYIMEVAGFCDIALSFAGPSSGNDAVIDCTVVYAKNDGKYSVKRIASNIEVSGATPYSIIDTLEVSSVNYKVPGKIQGKVFYAR